jgi:hypothetical protein
VYSFPPLFMLFILSCLSVLGTLVLFIFFPIFIYLLSLLINTADAITNNLVFFFVRFIKACLGVVELAYVSGVIWQEVCSILFIVLVLRLYIIHNRFRTFITCGGAGLVERGPHQVN